MEKASSEKEHAGPANTPEAMAPAMPNGTWDMSQERAFVENLLNQRFNFFLVFYSLVVVAAVSAETDFQLKMVLLIGTVIGGLLALPIIRAQSRLNIILDYLFEMEPKHPATYTNDRTYSPMNYPFLLRFVARGRTRIVGYLIPSLCSTTLIIASLLAIAGIITTAGEPPPCQPP